MSAPPAPGASPRPETGRRRVLAGIGLAIVVAAGLGVHAFLPDTAGSDIAGDALYAVAAYLAVVFVAPRVPAIAVGALAAGWCVAVELFQLTGVPEALSAFPPAMLVLGTVFDARDLVVYVLTIAAATLVDTLLTSQRGAGR